jgi:hypothetical protein
MFEHEFPRSMGRQRSTNCVTLIFSWSYASGLFSLGLCERPAVQPKGEYTGQNSKHGAQQQLQMLQRTCYREPGRRWTLGGRHTDGAHCEVFRALQFLRLCVERNCINWWKEYRKERLISVFVTKLHVPEILAFFWQILYLFLTFSWLVWASEWMSLQALQHLPKTPFIKADAKLNEIKHLSNYRVV